MGQQARVAVIGAGPSGLYAAAALLASGEPVSVEVLDRLPAPYGLVRYGVAPDHVKMKSVIRVLQKPFDPAHVEFLGGVRVGEGGIPLEVLREHFHAIVHATGSSVDRELDVPGEELAGSFGSGAFVSWYCGHPDHTELDPALDHPGVAVVGAGNVALDVARVLARTSDEMAETDVPPPVLDALRSSAVRDVHVLIRRAPAARPVHPGGAAPDRRAGRRRRPRARRRPAGGGRRGARGTTAATEPGHAHRVGVAGAGRPPPADPPALPAQPRPGDRRERPRLGPRHRAQRDRRRRARDRHRRGGGARRRARRPGHRVPGRARSRACPSTSGRAPCPTRAAGWCGTAWSCRARTSPAGSSAVRAA